ncbi:MAG: hypothetical protein FD166_2945 [Bacteroidetes bacterium]|nr:MAG: hypothetical protein FD166_2945 [Bacteroidota bacterium]
MMKTTEKTVRQLFDEFKQKYTTDQIPASVELSMLFKHLQYHCSFSNGNYVHVPGPQIQGLIQKHLNYSFKKTKSPAIADRTS